MDLQDGKPHPRKHDAGRSWIRRMNVLLPILLATLAGGVLSVLAAALVAFAVLDIWVPRMVSYATGVLLGAAFLDVLPEALGSDIPHERIMAAVLAGIVAFFLLEKAALWRHDHTPPSEQAVRPAGIMILAGDGFHNLVDGVLLAAAFLQDFKLGIATALAVIAHEIPQEVGDFMVLLDSGFSRKTALLLNVLSSLTSVAGGVLGYFLLERVEGAIPYALAMAGASFIYIAVADLIPELHRNIGAKASLSQFGLILLGIVTVPVSHRLVA
jgi:zinc and cadmium transporter